MNGDYEYVRNLKSINYDLPEKQKFQLFLNVYSKVNTLEFKDTILKPEYTGGTRGGFLLMTYDNGDPLFYFPDGRLNFSFSDKYPTFNYESRILNKAYDNMRDERFLFLIDKSSIRVYDVLNEELISYYDINFSINPKPIPQPSRGKDSHFLAVKFKKDIFYGEFENK